MDGRSTVQAAGKAGRNGRRAESVDPLQNQGGSNGARWEAGADDSHIASATGGSSLATDHRRASPWLLGAAVGVVTLACLGLLFVHAYIATRVEALHHLSDLKEGVHEIEAIEWRAIAEAGTGQGARALAEERFRDGAKRIEQTRALPLLSDRESLERVAEQHRSYRALVTQELRLTEAGRLDEARALDRGQVDPTFEELHDAIAELKAAFEEQVRRAFALGTLGSLWIVGAATTAIGLLVSRLWQSRALARVLAARGEAVREQEQRFRALVQNSADVIAVLQEDGTIRHITPASNRVLGQAPERLMGRNIAEFIHADDMPSVQAFLATMREHRVEQTRIEFRWRHADGAWIYLDTTWSDQSATPSVAGLVVNARDINEQKTLEEQLRQQALYDPLTKLANRTLFWDRLDQAMARAARGRGSVSVLVLDIDNFKSINDRFGHAVGDEVLNVVAQRIRGAIRAVDTAARLGGDEFAILCEMIRGSDPARLVARVASSFERPFQLEAGEVPVHVSIGIATWVPARESAETLADDLVRQADIAMYQAKASGKGTSATFEEGMRMEAIGDGDLPADEWSARERPGPSLAARAD